MKEFNHKYWSVSVLIQQKERTVGVMGCQGLVLFFCFSPGIKKKIKKSLQTEDIQSSR